MSITAESLRYRTTDRARRAGARVGDLVRTGPTVPDARAAVETAALAALTGSYSPTVITAAGWVAVVAREPDGWGYAVADVAGAETGARRLYPSAEHAERAGAERDARRHLAQLVDEVTGWELLEECTQADRDEYARWLTFQRRYRALADAGYPDAECHHIAGGLGVWPEHVAPVWPVLASASV